MSQFIETYNKYIKPGEGGYANHANDKGGETYRGVARRYHPNWPGWDIIDHIKTKRTIKTNEIIPEAEQLAENFYEEMWDRVGFNWIKSQKVADFLFDFFVNSGFSAIKSVQKVLDLKADGVMGPLTLSAINQAGDALFDELWDARRYFFLKIVQQNPDQKAFYNGWINRLNKFK